MKFEFVLAYRIVMIQHFLGKLQVTKETSHLIDDIALSLNALIVASGTGVHGLGAPYARLVLASRRLVDKLNDGSMAKTFTTLQANALEDWAMGRHDHTIPYPG